MARQLKVDITGDASSYQRALSSATNSTSRFGSTLGTLAKTSAFAAGAAGVGAIAVTLRAGIKEYTESAKVAAQTNAVIKSTGGAANVTAKEVDQLAESLMKKSGVDDEAIKSSQNLLLGFKNIRNEVGKGNDVFNQATAAVLDYSVRTGRDATGAAVMFGKALNDPVTGLSKLARAGITFTDAQKAQIKALQESGDVMGAQKVILAELEKRYGGAAEAAGNTLPGQLSILKESFNNFAGDLVARAAPALQRFVDFLNRVLQADGFKAKLKIVWEGLENVASDLNTRLKAQLAAINWTELFISGFKAINWTEVVMGVFRGIITVSKTQWEVISSIWLGAWRAILTGLQALVGQIIAAVSNAMTGAVNAVRNAAGAALSAAIALGQRIVDGIRSGLSTIANVVRSAVQRVIDVVRGFVGTALSAGAAIGRAIMEGIGQGIMSLASSIASRAADAIHGIIDHLKSIAKIRSPSGLFAEEIGQPMAEGIIDGLVGGLGDLGEALSVALEEQLTDARTGYAQSVSSFASWAKGLWDAEMADIGAVGEFGQKAAGGGEKGASPFGGSVPTQAAPITVHINAPIGNERDLEDMVRGALSRVSGRQGYA